MVDEPLDVVLELRQQRYIAAKLRRWQLNLQEIQENSSSCNEDNLKSQSRVVSSSPRCLSLRQSSVEKTTSSYSPTRDRDSSTRSHDISHDRKCDRTIWAGQLLSQSAVHSGYSTLPSKRNNRLHLQSKSYSTLPIPKLRHKSRSKPARTRSDHRSSSSHTSTPPEDPISNSSENHAFSKTFSFKRRSSSSRTSTCHSDDREADKKTLPPCDELVTDGGEVVGMPISISINSFASNSAVCMYQ